MADGLYAKARQKFLTKLLDWTGDDIRFIFVKVTSGYTVNLATDADLTVISGGNRIATSGSLSSKTATDGVADAADETVASVSGAAFQAIVFYMHTGTDATSIPIAYVDSYTGLPCTPNGSNITVAFPSDGNRIIKL